jgi:hypothetical protein
VGAPLLLADLPASLQLLRITSFALLGGAALVSAGGLHDLRPSKPVSPRWTAVCWTRPAFRSVTQPVRSTFLDWAVVCWTHLASPSVEQPVLLQLARSPALLKPPATPRPPVPLLPAPTRLTSAGNKPPLATTSRALAVLARRSAVSLNPITPPRGFVYSQTLFIFTGNTMISDDATKSSVSNLAGLQSIEGMVGVSRARW